MAMRQTIFVLACLACTGVTHPRSQRIPLVGPVQAPIVFPLPYNPSDSFQRLSLRSHFQVARRYFARSRPNIAPCDPWMICIPAGASKQRRVAVHSEVTPLAGAEDADHRRGGVYSYLTAHGFDCSADGCSWEEDLLDSKHSLVNMEKSNIAKAEVRLACAKTDVERSAAEADILRSEAVLKQAQDVDGRALHFASKIQGGLLHLDVDKLKQLGSGIADIMEIDAAQAAAKAYDDSTRYLQRVQELALRELGSQGNTHNLVQTRAKQLLASHGYKALRRDLIFGPYIRAAERIVVDQVSSRHNPRRIRKPIARVGLFAARKLWSSPLPLPIKKRMAEVAVTEALHLMTAQYRSHVFVDMADRSLMDYRHARLKVSGEVTDLKCPWPFVLVHAPLGGAKKHPVKTIALTTIAAWYVWRLGWMRFLV